MPEEEKKQEEKKQEKKEKKLSPIIKFLIPTLLIAVLSAFISFFIAKSQMQKRIQPTDKGYVTSPPYQPLQTEIVGDFVVRLKDPYEEHYLKVESLTLAYNATKYKKLVRELAQRNPQIKDLVDSILQERTSQIVTKEGKLLLKKEIINAVNEILESGKIEDVYFTMVYQ